MLKPIVFATCAAFVATSFTAAPPAQAYCKFGEQTRPGSLGNRQRDNSRFYTLTGGGRIAIEVYDGGPLRMNLGCGWRTGYSHSCYRRGSGRKGAQLRNTSGGQILYGFSCFDD